jgi:hypothetical protein
MAFTIGGVAFSCGIFSLRLKLSSRGGIGCGFSPSGPGWKTVAGSYPVEHLIASINI